jgi:hypothetical protein
MNISLVTCFKERVDFLKDLFESLKRTTKHPEKIELLVALDKGDVKGIEGLNRLIKDFPIKVIAREYEPSDFLIRTHMNPIIKLASGRWIIGISDDSRFVTKDWDLQLWLAMTEMAHLLGDDILLGMLGDGLDHDGLDFSCWPVLSKQAHDVLGHWHLEEFFFWGADHFVADVYRRMGRVVNLRHILVDHYTYHNGQRPLDTNGMKFKALADIYGCAFTMEMVNQEINKLQQFITEKSQKT